jgi:hypothetical protein
MSEKEIATALILLKARHQLSNTCVKDICRLLRLLKVPNAPKNYSRIIRVFRRQTCPSDTSTTTTICTVCNQTCTDETHCDNVDCTQKDSFTCSPLQFVRLPILPQVRDILARTQHLNFRRQDEDILSGDSIRDIYDGAAYDRILTSEGKKRFLTLLINVDGIQIAKSSNSSLWIITLVINELKRSERFKMKNVIIAGISSGKNKPSRDHMYTILSPIVQELKQLEYGRYFDLSASNNELEPLRIFLLAACLDKPAQALVQNLNEPIAAYGCGRCEIEGKSFLSCLIKN